LDQEINTNDDDEKSFFKKNDLFHRASTSRSMTIKIKTMKTSDINIQDDSAQQFLKNHYGDEDGQVSFDDDKTMVTSQ